MVDLKNKKLYSLLQIKLFNYSKLLEDSFNTYLENPSENTYKKIVNINDTINQLINESERLQINIIYYELLG